MELGSAFDIESNTIQEREKDDGSSREKSIFSFDHIFTQDHSNAVIYDSCIREIVDSTMDGFNSTCFAYGQTSSGKTHTIFGTKNDEGMIPLAVRHIFERARSTSKEWLFRCAYLEIYNENLYDLLNPRTESSSLVVHENKKGFIVVDNLTWEIVTDFEEAMRYVFKGNRNRRVAATRMNRQSSRSHAIFSIIIESNEIRRSDTEFTPRLNKTSTSKPYDGSFTLSSQLYIVDLAGSERLKKSGSQGTTQKEGTAINKSLHALSRVITELSRVEGKKRGKKNARSPFIPYRDSKLTRVIQMGLGGNSKLCVICCLNPGLSHVDESLSTLRFASSAKKIQNSSKKNEVMDARSLLKRYKSEIELLKTKLQEHQNAETTNHVSPSLSSEDLIFHREMQEQLKQEKEQRIELQAIVDHLTNVIVVGSSTPRQGRRRGASQFSKGEKRLLLTTSSVLEEHDIDENFNVRSTNHDRLSLNELRARNKLKALALQEVNQALLDDTTDGYSSEDEYDYDDVFITSDETHQDGSLESVTNGLDEPGDYTLETEIMKRKIQTLEEEMEKMRKTTSYEHKKLQDRLNEVLVENSNLRKQIRERDASLNARKLDQKILEEKLVYLAQQLEMSERDAGEEKMHLDQQIGNISQDFNAYKSRTQAFELESDEDKREEIVQKQNDDKNIESANEEYELISKGKMDMKADCIENEQPSRSLCDNSHETECPEQEIRSGHYLRTDNFHFNTCSSSIHSSLLVDSRGYQTAMITLPTDRIVKNFLYEMECITSSLANWEQMLESFQGVCNDE